MVLGIKETPTLEHLLAKDGAYARGIVFNFTQARVMFSQNHRPDLMLCIDGRLNKWVTNLHEAHHFYYPLAVFNCEECNEEFYQPKLEGVIVVCPKCESLPTLVIDKIADKKREAEKLLEEV